MHIYNARGLCSKSAIMYFNHIAAESFRSLAASIENYNIIDKSTE